MKHQQAVDEIFELYLKHGSGNYIGEKISQVEHMCQAAQLAEAAGYDEEVILAAFFHDIGHLAVSMNAENNMGGYGVANHEKEGAGYLRARGFNERVAQLVEMHVQAKRYLTFKDNNYYNGLSEASKKTLEYQGGKMDAQEAAAFEANPLHPLIVAMRRWDEQAKLENVPLPDLDKYRTMALNVLQRAV